MASKCQDGRSSPEVRALRSKHFKALRARETAERKRRLTKAMKAPPWNKADTRILRKAYAAYEAETTSYKLFVVALLKYVDPISKETGDKLLRASKQSINGMAVNTVQFLINDKVCQHCRMYAAELYCLNCRKISGLRDEFVATIIKKREQTCTRIYGEGIISPTQVESVKKRIQLSTKAKIGYAFPAQHPKHRKASSERLKNPKNYAILMDGMERRHGVRNAMQVPGAVEKCAKTWAEHYEHGHPLRDPDIYAQVCSSSKQFKEMSVRNRRYRYQGYEGYIITKLCERYQVSDVEGQLMWRRGKWRRVLPHYIVGKHVYYPDLGIRSLRLLIEVKSTYTFCESKPAFETTRKKVLAVEKAGSKIAVVVADPRKDKYVIIPKEWTSWTRRRVQLYISRRGISVKGL